MESGKAVYDLIKYVCLQGHGNDNRNGGCAMSVSVDPVMQESARFHRLPARMQKEYADFERFALTMLLWEPISISSKHGGNIQRFMEWLYVEKGHRSCIGVTAKECIEFITHVVGEKQLAHETIKKYRSSLIALLHWQFNEGKISGDEIIRLEKIRVSKKKHYRAKPVKAMRRYELAAVFQNIDAKWPYNPKAMDRYARGIVVGTGGVRSSLSNMQRFTIVLLALHTGMRRSEIFSLKIQDVDPRNSTIYIVGKGGKPRHCMYPEVLREQMARFLAHRALVVGEKHDGLWFGMHGEWGKPPAFNSFRKWMAVIFDGDVDAGWHILRRTFATNCEKIGMPIGQISELLGHSDERTTRIYLERDKSFVIETTQAYEHQLAAKFEGLIPPRPHEKSA